MRTVARSASEPSRAKKSPKVSDQYSVKKGDFVADRQEILRLWSYLENPPGCEKLDWLYLNNPAGHGKVYLLYFEPERRPVGVICIGRRDFQIGNETYHGGVFGDYAIEPLHRSLGPALYFQREYLKIVHESTDVIYGFPNDSSAKVRTYGGYKLDGALDVYVLPIGIQHYFPPRTPKWFATATSKIANVLIQLTTYFSTRQVVSNYAHRRVDRAFVDQLWKLSCTKDIKSGVRNWSFLQWRLLENPYGPINLIGIADQDGHPAGYVAHCERKDMSVNIVDYHAVDADALAALLSFLIQRKIRDGAKSISIVSSDTDVSRLRWLRRLRFSKRRHQTYFISLGRSAQDRFDKLEIQMTLADNDV